MILFTLSLMIGTAGRPLVINDGSTDATLAVLVEEFDLVAHPAPLRPSVPPQPIAAGYRSRRYATLR
ncbi:hypothetical protein U8L64_00555, partial [Pseudomonas sp. FIP_A4]